MTKDYLEHHGIKGQKWGVRRYQNPDGSLTAAGKRRIKQEFSKRLDSDIEYEKKLNSELSKKGIVKNKNDVVLKKILLWVDIQQTIMKEMKETNTLI